MLTAEIVPGEEYLVKYKFLRCQRNAPPLRVTAIEALGRGVMRARFAWYVATNVEGVDPSLVTGMIARGEIKYVPSWREITLRATAFIAPWIDVPSPVVATPPAHLGLPGTGLAQRHVAAQTPMGAM